MPNPKKFGFNLSFCFHHTVHIGGENTFEYKQYMFYKAYSLKAVMEKLGQNGKFEKEMQIVNQVLIVVLLHSVINTCATKEYMANNIDLLF